MPATVSQLRQYLRIAHSLDDALLGFLLSAAELEARRFLGLADTEALPDTDDVRTALYLLVQAHYEGARPDDRLALRRAAEVLLTPYRTGWGV